MPFTLPGERSDEKNTYVSARELHCGVAVDVGEQAQTEALGVGWICKSVHCEGGLGRVKDLSHALVQLVVGDGAPEGRLAVRDQFQSCIKVSRGNQQPHVFMKNRSAARDFDSGNQSKNSCLFFF